MAENGEGYVSGGALSRELSISRSAVWKAVESLRADGHDISAVTNRGYRLESSGDTLSAAGIEAYLRTGGVFRIEVRKTVESTNTVLRGAADNLPEGFVLVAEGQTAGKGRLGRGFHSPPGHGVYFSLLLRPGAKSADAALITSAAAVAVARAIEKVFGIRAGIKWVNDLFVRGKKVCGILTEAVFGMESGMVESAVLGIGINITSPGSGFPEGVRDVAAALTDRREGKDLERCRLIAAALDNFWEYYQNLAGREFLDEYRARSIVLGQDVIVLSGDSAKPARALAIDGNCGLTVGFENGETVTLNSGEVRIKPIAQRLDEGESETGEVKSESKGGE